MEYKLSSHITESCCRLSATYAEQCSKKIEDRDTRETRERKEKTAQQELVRDRQTCKMKQGEKRRHRENSNEKEKCVEGGVSRGADSQNSNKKWSF